METTIFWNTAPRSLTLMMDPVSTAETPINFYQSARRYNPEDSHLYEISSLKQPISTFLSHPS
jgi:hypothetical protein